MADDKEFLDTIISERMEMHYAKEHPPLLGDELAAALQLETEYNLALEQLSPEAASAVKKFHETVVNQLSEDGIFFFKKGISDGLRLYRTLQNL